MLSYRPAFLLSFFIFIKRLFIRQMKIKTIMRSCLTPVRMPIIKSLQTINVGEGVEKRKPSCTVGGNVNWYSHYGRRYRDTLKNLAIKPPYNPAIPLLGIYPEEIKIEKDTRTPMFIVVLFTISRTWKQSRCPSKDEEIKDLWYICTVEYYSAVQRNAFMSFLKR